MALPSPNLKEDLTLRAAPNASPLYHGLASFDNGRRYAFRFRGSGRGVEGLQKPMVAFRVRLFVRHLSYAIQENLKLGLVYVQLVGNLGHGV